MGGYGSGSHGCYSAKDTVEDCYALDVNWMTREGMFDGDGWRSGSIRWSNSQTGEETSSISYELNTRERWVRLHYRLIRSDTSVDYKVPLTTTDLPWGGVRYWFVCALTCNGRYCGRRVGKLYLAPGGRYYGCRHCNNLTYTSCQESRRPSGIDHLLDCESGMSYSDLLWVLNEGKKADRRLELNEKRNEQRRRRRKARNWA
jgi:hypothetical protein